MKANYYQFIEGWGQALLFAGITIGMYAAYVLAGIYDKRKNKEGK
jgi:hypothetical protein